MYVKIKSRFFYLIIFIDEYSRYIAHHAVMTSMDSNSVSMEAQRAIEDLKRDSLTSPEIQSDNGSAFISLDFKIVLNSNEPYSQEDPPSRSRAEWHSGEGKQDDEGRAIPTDYNGLPERSERDIQDHTLVQQREDSFIA